MTLVRALLGVRRSQAGIFDRGRWLAIQGRGPWLSLIGWRRACCWWFAERTASPAVGLDLAEQQLQANLGLVGWRGL